MYSPNSHFSEMRASIQPLAMHGYLAVSVSDCKFKRGILETQGWHSPTKKKKASEAFITR